MPSRRVYDRHVTRRILILAAGVGSGHNQAASAIESAFDDLPDAAEVRRLDILETTSGVFNRLYDDAYFALVAEVPWLVGWGYDHQEPPFRLAPLVQWWDQLNTLPVAREIRAYDPDLVICTHFLPARMVSLMLARRQLRAALTVVATDYDFQGLWLASPFTRFFVAREETREYMTQLGVPEDRISVSGIPVRSGLAEPVDDGVVRQRFGLHSELPVVLISAGAAGGPYTLQVVRQVLRSEQRYQAVVVCGRNEELRAQVEELAAQRPDRFRVLGYTTEMADLMRISCLFVGKPGGLSASECMAAGLPMVLVKPIPGQEVRNADFLLEAGAAVRCNYATTVGYKIDQLLADPGRLATMAANARGIGFPDAARTIAEQSLAAETPPLWISREAQKSISQAVEDGLAAADLDPSSRLRTLRDPDGGGSLAVFTEAQLGAIGVTGATRSVDLSERIIKALRWQPENLDLAIAGKWLLGDASGQSFGLD